MVNIPDIKLGIVVGSTDWLPSNLAEEQRRKFIAHVQSLQPDINIHECAICITDNEATIKRVKRDLAKAECDALCLYWGNYGPESAGTLLADEFDGPVMMIGAADEHQSELFHNRMDSLSGFINACYALNLRKTNVYIPRNPIGTVEQCSEMLIEFNAIARAVIASRSLKIISIGPRPTSYLASLAPIHPLYSLGVEISEYSELEVFNSYNKHLDDVRIEKIVQEMKEELSMTDGCAILSKFAQYEATLFDWARVHKGDRKYVTMTSTCWPAFPVNYEFNPCYVHSRVTGQGIPVSCEVDIYGAFCEYIGQVVSGDIVTVLNINNNVPRDFYDENIKGVEFEGSVYNYSDLIIGYHCGVTCSKKLETAVLRPHYVNSQLIGEEKSQGTVQGKIVSGAVTIFRIQGTSDGRLIAYVAEGEILPVNMNTYGGYGVIAIREMGRFVRNVVIEKHFPNHMTVVFGHHAKLLTETIRFLGIKEIYSNNPKNILYESESIYDYEN